LQANTGKTSKFKQYQDYLNGKSAKGSIKEQDDIYYHSTTKQLMQHKKLMKA